MNWNTATEYDHCVAAAKEAILAEKRKRQASEWLSGEKDTHKTAARIWFNLLTEVWPPERSERYWERVSEKFNEVWNENPDNALLRQLLLMTHEYLSDALEEYTSIAEGKHDQAG